MWTIRRMTSQGLLYLHLLLFLFYWIFYTLQLFVLWLSHTRLLQSNAMSYIWWHPLLICIGTIFIWFWCIDLCDFASIARENISSVNRKYLINKWCLRTKTHIWSTWSIMAEMKLAVCVRCEWLSGRCDQLLSIRHFISFLIWFLLVSFSQISYFRLLLFVFICSKFIVRLNCNGLGHGWMDGRRCDSGYPRMACSLRIRVIGEDRVDIVFIGFVILCVAVNWPDWKRSANSTMLGRREQLIEYGISMRFRVISV